MKTIPLSNHIRLTDFELKSTQPTITNTSHNEKTSAISRNIQYYSGSVELTAFGNEACRELTAFMESLNGRANEFFIKLPNTQSQKTVSGNPTVNIPYSAGSTEIVPSAFIGTISAGDYFTFNNHSKVYKATSTVTQNQTLTFSPSLRVDIPVLSTLQVQDVYFKVRLTEDDYSIKSTNGTTNVLKIKFSFKESL